MVPSGQGPQKKGGSDVPWSYLNQKLFAPHTANRRVLVKWYRGVRIDGGRLGFPRLPAKMQKEVLRKHLIRL
jgi:hypothetical protein